MSYNYTKHMEKKFLLGVGISDVTKNQALEFIITSLEKRAKKVSIFTPNPEIIMAALKDDSFKKVVNTASLALPDGVGVLWAGKLLGEPFQSRITGVDFMLELCKEAAKRGFTIGLFGGGKQIAERAAECLLAKYPSLKISYVSDGGDKIQNTKYKIPNTDILFVALGFPKQEKWIYENLPRIPVQVAMTVGGAFDYISGAVPRAPLFVRNLGLEWFFRLLIQPWRLRRQLVLFKFIFLVLRNRLFSTSK